MEVVIKGDGDGDGDGDYSASIIILILLKIYDHILADADEKRSESWEQNNGSLLSCLPNDNIKKYAYPMPCHAMLISR